jgi:hypothetical protein
MTNNVSNKALEEPYYLYMITNSVNGKRYVGRTGNPTQRFRDHMSKSSCCTKLKNAIKKYGKHSFTMQIICVGSFEYICDLEPKVIAMYGLVSEYNISNGSRGGNVGKSIVKRKDDYFCYIDGFWFPSRRVAMSALCLGRDSFYRKLKKCELNPVRIPCFKVRPDRNSEEDLKRRRSVKTGPVLVSIMGEVYSSIKDAILHTGLTRDQISYRIDNPKFPDFYRINNNDRKTPHI